MKRSREPSEYLDSNFQNQDTPDWVEFRDAALPAAKIPQLDIAIQDEDDADADANTDGTPTMKCSLPPHMEPITFRSYQEYESHYNIFHTNRCLECRKNFPSEHLLGVHLEEYHDPLVRVRRDRGEHTFSCFVEGCERKCLTHQKRRLHMIDKHMYPKNFFFGVTKEGIDGRRSLLVEGDHRRRRSSTASIAHEARRRAGTLKEQDAGSKDDVKHMKLLSSDHVKETTSKRENVDADMADLTETMSALQFVPHSIRFGRGGRAGFSKS
ncbi:C2H2 type zinc finger domain protein [Metarhizium album ARSEF 1941]|uniref:C2H2 type zinc finger domain protein n=1 Tax=Metarhizium album (strain ARSEF 1941) TaxID=1081103 RepID=A0A0B2WNP6_METAS|nr:C2H2 type zinc finger domain protein [Metarhizium album ARSEF 1941]KHN95117.1 C2H2 type zinc finger domain protein [Metarhizium album ARSEF 1941]